MTAVSISFVSAMPGQPVLAASNVARDPEIAVIEEFTTAEKKGTRAAYELFIARHPTSALAEAARMRLEKLKLRKE